MEDRIPFLGFDGREEYSFKLNEKLMALSVPWKSYPRAFYDEFFLSPKGMNLDDPFDGIEFVRLSSKTRDHNFIQVDFYGLNLDKGMIDKVYDRGYKKLKQDSYALILLKPVIFERELLSELEFISENFEINEANKNSFPKYN